MPEKKPTVEEKGICVIEDKFFIDSKPTLPPLEMSNCVLIERVIGL